MVKLIEKHPVLSIIIFSALMLLPNLDSLVVTIMEARNFITAREMVNDNHWILTTMNGTARYQKPPLPTWLTAISGILFGIKSLFALRLPAALMVSFSGVFMYLVSKKLSISNSVSIRIAFVFITSFYVVGIINEAPWDIFTHGFMLAGIYFLIHFFQNQKRFWKHALAAAFFVGLSLMSKGPVSLYVLFLPFIIAYSIVYKYENFKPKRMALIIFILLFIIIGGWWFYYVRAVDPEIFETITSRETSNWSNYNVRPFYYYWSFFIQSGMWTILAFTSLLYPYLIKKVENKKLYNFSFLWTIFAVFLLSIIPEKKSRYLVPVLFPLAITTGIYINYLIKNFKTLTSKKEIYPVNFNFGLFSILGIAIPIAFFILFKDKLNDYWFQFSLFSVALISIGIFIFKNIRQKNIKNTFYGMVFFMGAAFLFGLPLSASLYSNQQFKSIESLTETFEKDYKIQSYAYKSLSPELIWHYGKNIAIIKSINGVQLSPIKKIGLLIDQAKEQELEKLQRTHNIKKVATFDMNYDSKNKSRLIRNYYIIIKKPTFE
ncbi:MAG: phospholipid carrier-dependent glycosyltransferase [Urechidicola sp.]|nr:phospholipid carrier-dependent glycosyltransferase [Urechidicola sp.]